MLALFLPQLLRLLETATSAAPSYGRLVDMTLYQSQGKQYNVVRVMQSGDENGMCFRYWSTTWNPEKGWQSHSVWSFSAPPCRATRSLRISRMAMSIW